ncbi:hypothetical protein MRQ36_27410 [Micromonospora sp. R77]|uniref:hypothetical protein n=1 Tax=Micromonospora sp. R77 TaxID=2925836 RepID=UPI001F61D4F1|nr:hypothetical protein [Micromonospora sp. R77]MCI4066072.1 hypothetical protein [Micromonospora sp. R77]
MTPILRRWLTVGLLGLAAAAVAVTVVANNDGAGGLAWRCPGGGLLCESPKQGGHIYLRPLAHPLLGVALAAGLVAAAAQLAIRHRVARWALHTVTAVVAAAGLLLSMVPQFGQTYQDAVVATSPDFKLVSYRWPGFFSSDKVLLRLQSREGIASRESIDSLACFMAAASGTGPAWLFGRARFLDDGEIALSAKDGTTWRIRFDTKTLSPVNPVDRCTDAPDPAADYDGTGSDTSDED